MEKPEILSKLIALRSNLVKFLQRPKDNYFDPKYVLDLFHRYISIRDELLSNYSSLFGDLPKRETPKPSKTTDYDGRGYIERPDIEILNNDIEYCIDILKKMPSFSDVGSVPYWCHIPLVLISADQPIFPLRRSAEPPSAQRAMTQARF